MSRFLLFPALLLSLVGCGKEFTASREPVNNIAGMPDAGEAGDTSMGSSGGPSVGGSGLTGGGSAGIQTGGSNNQGGAGFSGSSSLGGASGAPAGGTGGAPPLMVCNAGVTQCSNGTFQTCKNDGSGWSSETCGFVCDGQKGCLGSCTPGDQQCSGTNSQTCDTVGKWVTTTTCPFVCSGKGVCGGSCVPGEHQCSGVNTQTCNSDGYWATTQSCPIACTFSNGTASCGGACTNGAHQCSGKVPQTCTANEWTSGAQCSYVCSNSTGTCGGECVPGSQKCGPQGGIQSCSAAGVWQNEGAPCPFTCSNGACGGMCVPNAGCADDGNACTDDVCNAQGTACLHPAKTNGATCGSSSSSACDDADSCVNGTCQPNPKAAQTACTNDLNVCTNDVCDGAGSCQHPATPAATVCRAASCSNGVTTAQATCGGSTSCPVAQTTNCFGSCDAGGLMCLNTAPQKVDDVSGSPLAIDNDASFVYASTRTTAGVSQIVQYAKQNGAKTVLYQSSDTTKWIYSLIVAGTSLYFGETFWNPALVSGQVSRITTSGALQTAALVSGQATFGFAKNSTRVYWNDGTRDPCFCANPSHRVYSVPIGGNVVTTFALPFNGTELVPDLEVTDTSLYVWKMQPYGAPWIYKPVLSRYSLSDPFNSNADLVPGYYTKPGNVQVETRGNTPGLTKNGQYVLANVNSATDNVAFFSFKIADDAKTLLATSYGFVNGMGTSMNANWTFAADDTNLYLNNVRLPVAGGSLSYWTNHSLADSALSVDGTFLYFGSWGYWNDLPYDNVPDVSATSLFKAGRP